MHYDVKNLYKTSGCFQRLARSAVFENTTMVMITIYAIYMSVDTDWNTADLITETHPFFIVCEQVFCLYFVFELLVRFGAFQRKCNAFKDAWFVFDFILVVMMVAETWVMNLIILTMASAAGASNFLGDAAILRIARLMRLTRLLRMARLIRMVPELLIMVKAVASAARSVGFTLILLGICLYVFAIAFRAVLDGTQVGATYFPNVAVAMHSLFVHGTFLDNIAELFKQMKEQSAIGFSLLYVFVIMSAVTIMNMLIGVLCEVITAVADAEKEALQVSWTTEVLQRCLQAGADTDNDGCIDIDEFQQMISTPKVLQVLKEADVDVSTLVNFADVLFEGDDEQLMTKVPFKDFMTRLLKFRGTNTATVKDLVDLRKCITKELQQVQENAGNSAHPAEFILHRFVETGQRVLGKEVSTWFGPTSAAQAVGHLFQEATKAGNPEFLKGIRCAVFVDGPIYKVSVTEHFDAGATAVILFVCRRLGLDSCNLDEYQEGLQSCFGLPEFQGLASGNSSSSAHFFVATHSEDSLLFLDPHVTRPALQSARDIVASSGLRTERPLRLPWSNLNPSVCMAFLVRSKAEHRAQHMELQGPAWELGGGGVACLSVVGGNQGCRHEKKGSLVCCGRLGNCLTRTSRRRVSLEGLGGVFDATEICRSFRAKDSQGVLHQANRSTVERWLKEGVRVPTEWQNASLLWAPLAEKFQRNEPGAEAMLVRFNTFRAQHVADLLCYVATTSCPLCLAVAMGSTKPSSDLDVSVTGLSANGTGPDAVVRSFNAAFARAWGKLEGLDITSAEKFDSNVYGFAWFEAHLCKGGICPSVTPGPCQVVEDYHGVQGQDGLQKWRMVRFSAEDNVEEQHIFAVAKLLYFLRKWGIEKKDPKCISEGSEEQIAFTMEDADFGQGAE
ncbi:unnamed protein product [Effrenium voratum]|nr:unnamed protein product [Effrenium voratum]